MYRWVDHTSEVELRVEAASAPDVFAEATVAVAELLGEARGEGAPRPLAVRAGDPPALLAAWLEELVYLSERDEAIPLRARDLRVVRERVEGEVEWAPGRPSYLVKAVTYHGLALECGADGCTARVVFDV